jgi:O-antigen/teichoic acid export membrane protein
MITPFEVDEAVPSRTISIGQEMVQAARWNIVATVGKYLVTTVAMVVVARFVTPQEFGLAAIALGAIAFFVLFTQFGFGQAIIGIHDVDQRFVHTLFTVSLFLAFLLYIILTAVAPFLSAFYRQPSLRMLLLVAGLTLFSSLSAAIPLAILQRNLRYRDQAIVLFCTAFGNAVSAGVLAVLGHGVWAIVVPPVIGSSVGAMVAFPLSQYRPRFAFDVKRLSRAMHFSVSGLISNLSNFVCNSAVPLVMGRTWNAASLGTYTFAYGKHAVVYDAIAAQFVGSAFPIFRKIAHDLHRCQRAFLSMVRFSAFVIPPTYAALIVGAPSLFPLLFGERWSVAVVPFQLLCVIPIVRSAAILSTSTLYAMGAPEIAARIVIIRTVGYGIAVSGGMLLRADIASLTMGLVIVDVLIIILYLRAVLGQLQISLRRYLSSIVVPGACAATYALLLAVVTSLVSTATQSPFGGFVVGAVVATVALLLIGSRVFPREWSIVRAALHAHT